MCAHICVFRLCVHIYVCLDYVVAIANYFQKAIMEIKATLLM